MPGARSAVTGLFRSRWCAWTEQPVLQVRNLYGAVPALPQACGVAAAIVSDC
jgi:hypothetical protein